MQLITKANLHMDLNEIEEAKSTILLGKNLFIIYYYYYLIIQKKK